MEPCFKILPPVPPACNRFSLFPHQLEQQLPGLPHDPGAPQHPPGDGAEKPGLDVEKFDADTSL